MSFIYRLIIFVSFWYQPFQVIPTCFYLTSSSHLKTGYHTLFRAWLHSMSLSVNHACNSLLISLWNSRSLKCQSSPAHDWHSRLDLQRTISVTFACLSSYTRYVILCQFLRKWLACASCVEEKNGSIQDLTITASKYNFKTHLGKTLKHFHRNVIHLLVHIIIITVCKLQ